MATFCIGLSSDSIAISAQSSKNLPAHDLYLIDEIKDDRVIARSKSDAPEIDGQVFIPQAPGLKIGTFAQVKITDSDDYDLYAISDIIQ